MFAGVIRDTAEMPGYSSSTPETFKTACCSFQPVIAGLGHVFKQPQPGRGTLSFRTLINVLIWVAVAVPDRRLGSGQVGKSQTQPRIQYAITVRRRRQTDRHTHTQELGCANTPEIGCASDDQVSVRGNPGFTVQLFLHQEHVCPVSTDQPS